MEVLREAAGVCKISKLAVTHLRDTYFIWKGVVGDLVPVYSTGHKRKKYVIWIMSDIDFRYLSAESDAMEALWQSIWTGTGFIRLGGGVPLGLGPILEP